MVELGTEGYEALDGDSADPATERVLFDLDCAVTSNAGEVVEAAGSLSFASCEPLP